MHMVLLWFQLGQESQIFVSFLIRTLLHVASDDNDDDDEGRGGVDVNGR